MPIQQAKKARREDFWSALDAGRPKHNMLSLADRDDDERAEWADFLRDAELGLYEMRCALV